MLSAVRHGDGITLASREIGAKANEIPEFAPLLDQVGDVDLAGAVITADALHAQHAHAAYLHERGAHYLLTIKNNQRGQARQLDRLPWKEIPVIHRDDTRGHGRHEQRHVEVVTVDGLLFPNARQVLRIQRRRRLYGAKKWSSETVYAITDLSTEHASAAEIAAWARGHRTVENTVHWVRDVVFGEDKSRVRTRNTPAVLAAVRDLIRSALKLAGTSTPRPDAGPTPNATASSPSTASHDQPDIRGKRRGPEPRHPSACPGFLARPSRSTEEGYRFVHFPDGCLRGHLCMMAAAVMASRAAPAHEVARAHLLAGRGD